ncbi:XapX domain-containing protein [Aquibacillus sp. 3ASR75-11]|uniref:XapX domain-containing protein n=1 Tax=Terrihalobacillus insolitus TaxID=2950438 RepID=A0A9X3WVY0_9BACI|nr:XapX domain-containing protein [Terrihalobacillus insolitus]MDC3414958.1 XapX domain-containing protein [Terrihalobacillus insolitus]MDC3425071.1 XapX domain-containing protein [Terrihalobacillus insolitus]
MKELILALLTGLVVGFIFAWIKLPIPAPPALAGVAGIVGIYAGFKLFQFVSPVLSRIFTW